MSTALITGITGQDGSYLAELLLSKGYKVYGLVRRLSATNYERIEHILDQITLLDGDLLDQSSLSRALEIATPDEVYNLAAQSHVGLSFEQPIATGEYNALGPVRLLEAIRRTGADIRFYQASTSELFGNVGRRQNELTPFRPRSPYAIAKLYAHQATINYRDAYGLFACCGILFNHESPRRGLDFVTRKISMGVARIRAGLQDSLELGNLQTYRDWGFAGDYVEAMWLMLQQDRPQEYVIATGESHTVGEFVEKAFAYAGLDAHKYVRISPRYYRPTDVTKLEGDATKARRDLEWAPRVSFEQLVAMMVEHDLERISNGKEQVRQTTH